MWPIAYVVCVGCGTAFPVTRAKAGAYVGSCGHCGARLRAPARVRYARAILPPPGPQARPQGTGAPLSRPCVEEGQRTRLPSTANACDPPTGRPDSAGHGAAEGRSAGDGRHGAG